MKQQNTPVIVRILLTPHHNTLRLPFTYLSIVIPTKTPDRQNSTSPITLEEFIIITIDSLKTGPFYQNSKNKNFHGASITPWSIS